MSILRTRAKPQQGSGILRDGIKLALRIICALAVAIMIGAALDDKYRLRPDVSEFAR